MRPEEQDQFLPRTIGPLLIRPLRAEDACAAAEVEYDPEVKRYMEIPRVPKSEWISHYSRYVVGDTSLFAVIDQAEGVYAGRASLVPYVIGVDCTPDENKRDLQIVIGSLFKGRGFGRMVADLLIPMAFAEFGAHTVTGTVHLENERGLKLLAAWNFVKVEEFSRRLTRCTSLPTRANGFWRAIRSAN
jgi:RimJ/RimL family protein N-acetyltransferase